MLLKNIRIRYYKSIIDSGICIIDEDMTILAGKNESGKSNILEALQDFNIDVILSLEKAPSFLKDKSPILDFCFELFDFEIEDFNDKFDAKLRPDKSYEIIVTKTIQGYGFDEKTIKVFGAQVSDNNELTKEREDKLISFIPNFILFTTFDDIIPDEIAYSEMNRKGILKDLFAISDFDANMIKSKEASEFMKHKREVYLRFNDDYSKFWIQDETKLKIDWNEGLVCFRFEEGDQYFKPSHRSKGKQWHLSFYIRLNARKNDDKMNVVLIDEPGLYLHAAAQKDVYSMLMDLTKTMQVIYTTHSPYLIKYEELERVRLVVKSDKLNIGTQVLSKIHSCSEKEALTPILTAIGLQLSDGIQNVTRKKNVVVEGPSDCFYLQAMASILESDLNFIFGGGSGCMGMVGSILTGWGCQVIYLFDNDKGFKDGSKNLKRSWKVKPDMIKKLNGDGDTTEDLFYKSDFKKHVLQNNEVKFRCSNSQFLKRHRCNKVLLAMIFKGKCNDGSLNLTKTTKDKFSDILKELNEAFENFESPHNR